MSGGGAIGSALGTGAGLLLAPETGGASLALPAALGAAGGAAGAGLTGGNALTGGLMGGASGLAGGFLSGLLSPAADEAASATDAGIGGATTGAGGATTGAGDIAANANVLGAAPPIDVPTGGMAGETNPLDMAENVGTGTPTGAGAAQSATPTWWQQNAPSWLGGSPSDPSNPSGASSSSGINPMSGQVTKGSGSLGGLGQYLLPAGLGLSALAAFLPKGSNPVNTSSVTNAQAQQSSNLPSYNYNSSQTPYQGSWYTYGQRPEGPMIQNTLTPAKHGGLIRHFANGGSVDDNPKPQHKPFVGPALRPLSLSDIANAVPTGALGTQQPSPPANSLGDTLQQYDTPVGQGYMQTRDMLNNLQGHRTGGMVRSLAMGGPPMQAPMMPQQAPPMGAIPPQQPQMPPQAPPLQPPQQNPLQAAAQFQMGQKIGQALRKHIKGTAPGMVRGPGTGQSDSIPAKLSANEYVIPADAVAHLGDGSSDGGGKVLDHMVRKVREHKTSHKGHFPPKARSPLAYARRA